MICAIEGELVGLRDGVAQVRVGGGLDYELMIPAYAHERLAAQVGRAVRLFTRHYLESQAQGAVLVPRLVGFGSPEERAFFELLTTVKGMGSRKALRALAEEPSAVAGAIARRDERALQKLPEIGKRLAETIIVDLADKVGRFAVVEVEAKSRRGSGRSAAGEAVAALVALGHAPGEAERAVDRALASARAGGEEFASADAIVTAALGGG